MDDGARRLVRDMVRGEVREDVPLAPMSSYRVGGPVDLLVEPADVEDLALLLSRCRAEGWPVLVLGGGSNLLVADSGFRGVGVRLSSAPFQGIEELGPGAEGPTLRLGGGVRVSRLMGRAGRFGWRRLAFLEGIPGTVGGCVRMNAGTRDGEIKDVLVRAEVVSPSGTVSDWPLEMLDFCYRHSALPAGAVVTAAVMDAGAGDPAEVKAAIQAHNDYRKATQPSGTSGGSVFRNPPGDFAGRLIEAAGCKGLSVGEACISERHANWIVTSPGATAADVYVLMERCRAEVQARFGVTLRTENVLVGFDA